MIFTTPGEEAEYILVYLVGWYVCAFISCRRNVTESITLQLRITVFVGEYFVTTALKMICNVNVASSGNVDMQQAMG